MAPSNSSFSAAKIISAKVEEKWEQLFCEQFLQRFEVSRTFLLAKQVGEKRGKFQNIVEIAHKYKVAFLILLSL